MTTKLQQAKDALLPIITRLQSTPLADCNSQWAAAIAADIKNTRVTFDTRIIDCAVHTLLKEY